MGCSIFLAQRLFSSLRGLDFAREVQQPTFIEEIGNDCLVRGVRHISAVKQKLCISIGECEPRLQSACFALLPQGSTLHSCHIATRCCTKIEKCQPLARTWLV